MGRRPHCPHCKSARVVKVVYGMPRLGLKLRRELDERRAVLGGLEIDNAPLWICGHCQREFGRSAKLDPGETFRFLAGLNGELTSVQSRLLTNGFEEEALTVGKARRMIAGDAEKLAAELGLELSTDPLGMRPTRRGEIWTEPETVLALDLLRRSETFPAQEEIEELAEYMGRSAGSVGRKLANLMAAQTGGLEGLRHRSRTDDAVVRQYSENDGRQLRREARRIRREWEDPLPETKEPSGLRKLEFEFWSAFVRQLEVGGTTIPIRPPRHNPWYDISLGRAGFYLAIAIDSRHREISCSLVIQLLSAKRAFRQLSADKTEIEKALGPLDWEELPDRQRSRISQRRDLDLIDRASWPEQLAWCQERAEKFHRVFAPRVRTVLL